MAFVDPLIGRQLAGFRLERLLGHGGMASVYYGIDQQLQRPVAVKVIAERFRGDPEYAGRFVREARAMAAWRHANIPQIYQAGEFDGISFYAMEYIEGMDLERLLKEYGRLGELPPYVDVLFIGRAIANALDYAHSRGVIHRDVKPSNVLVSQDDRVYLTDFGLVLDIARGTRGEVFGTPQYMSPEQARSSASVVPQSDLYSLGIILYEMLTGFVPFNDPVPATLALKQITEPPPSPREFNPSLSFEVEAVLLKALDKSPTGRYPSGRKLMDTLERALLVSSMSPQTAALGPTRPVTVPAPGEAPEFPAARTVSQLHASEIVAQQAFPTQATQAFPAGDKGYEAAAYPPPTAGSPRFPPAPSNPPGSPPHPPRSRSWWAGVGCAALAVLGVAALALGALINNAQSRQNPDLQATGVASGGGIFLPSSTMTPSEDLITSSPSPDPTRTPTATNSPTTTPTPTSTQTPTQTPEPLPTEVKAIETELLVFKYRDQSVVFRFEGPGVLPLKPLQLVKDRKILVDGERWEVNRLQRGDCVVVWRDKGDPDLPEDLECDYQGRPVERDRKNLFWLDSFDVYYEGDKVGTCEPNRDYCLIKIFQFPQEEDRRQPEDDD